MILGVDIGGSGIKGAPVDLATGAFAAQRIRVATPRPADVKQVVAAVAELARQFGPAEHVGITFPGVVVDGVTRTAANVDHSWIDAPAADLFSDALGLRVSVLNDADAAGIAEVTYGAGRDQPGLVVVLTFGTGIGSALFLDGKLIPNSEFGHLQVRGKDAEQRASDAAREADGMSWDKWAARVQEYLECIELLLRPHLFIIGGGVSKKADKFLPHIRLATPIVAATLHNDAGIVGAALASTIAADA